MEFAAFVFEGGSGEADAGSGSSPAPPPPFPPGGPPTISSDVFAGVTLLVGLVLLFGGHKFFRVFLGLTTFVIVTGGVGYVLLFQSDKSLMPEWAYALIAVGIGLGTGIFCSYAVTLGLFLGATISGGVAAALPLRLLAPSMAGPVRLTLIVASAALSAAATLYMLHKCRTPDDEDGAMPLTEAQRRQKIRAIYVRRVVTAVVTSIMGAYFIVHGLNTWWHDGDAHDESAIQVPALLNPSHTLPACGSSCIGLEILCAALLLAGLAVQLYSLCRKPRPGTEFAELQEPLATPSDQTASGRGSHSHSQRGSQSALAQRMRFKYCGGASASTAPVHTATSVTSSSGAFERAGVLPAGNEARPRQRSNRGSAGSAGEAALTPTAALTTPSSSWDRNAALPSDDPWANMGVRKAGAPSTPRTPGVEYTPPVAGSAVVAGGAGAPPVQPAGAQWPPSNPAWPPRDDD